MGKRPEVVAGGEMGMGPWRWLVTWGVPGRPGWHSIVVEAYDADDAMVLGAEARPDLPRPRTAFLARQEPVDGCGGPTWI